MTRLVSLGVILGLIAVFGLLSLRVMSSFMLPLLLAAMLVVIFGPLHRWLRDHLQAPSWVAAAATGSTRLRVVVRTFRKGVALASHSLGTESS
jgi:predicted PurR-regulated permease PerM